MATAIKLYVRDQLQFSCDDGILAVDCNAIQVWQKSSSSAFHVGSTHPMGSTMVYLYVVAEGNEAKVNETNDGYEVRVNE